MKEHPGIQQIKLFMGEGGKLLQTRFNQFVYQGGFMGNAFNDRVGKFRLILTAQEKNDTKFQFEGINCDYRDVRIARMGHLCFTDEDTGELIIFGGSKAGN